MGFLDIFKTKKIEEAVEVVAVPTEVKKEDRSNLVLTDTSFVTVSGLFTNELDVLNNSAVWSAIRYIATGISTLPLHVYSKKGRIREVVNTHPVAKVLEEPNPFMTKSVFMEVMAINLELFGVAYAEITRAENTLHKHPIMLLPISPRDVQVVVIEGNLNYLYAPTGKVIERDNLLIVMGSSLNGILPINPIKYMKSSLELAKAGEKLQQKYFEKGTMMGGVITVPRDFNNDEKARLKRAFDSAFTGTHNAYGTVVLNEGVEYKPITFNAEDNQLLESRNFTIQDVARRFGVSPYALGDLSKATFSNVEQQALNDMKNTFLPRVVKFEEAFNQKLFSKKEKETLYIKLSMEGMLRGDTATRYAAYNIALQNGFLTRNEIRALEDMNPVENADTLFVPLNMVSLDTATTFVPQGYFPVGEAKEVEPEVEKIEEVKVEEKVDYLAERVGVANSSRAKIERLVRRVLNQEITMLKEQMATIPQQGKEGFKQNFSSNVKEIINTFENDFLSIYMDIANKLNPIIAKELSKGDLANDAVLEDFVRKYTSTFLHRLSGKFVNDVYKDVDRATEDTLEDDLHERMNDWKQNLPARVRDEETVRSSNAFTKTLFVAYGVSKMKSVANFDACPICQKLDGKIVSIEGSFIDKDSDFEDGEGNVIHFHKNFSTPPFHQGCMCVIAPAD